MSAGGRRLLGLLTVLLVCGAAVGVVNPLPAAAAAPGQFKPLAPSRILDTRSNGPRTGTCTGGCNTLGPAGSLDVQVSGGTTGVPAGATAVVLNVTAVPGPNANPSFLTIYAKGGPKPDVSNLNYYGAAGISDTNLVEVPVSADGYVTAYNNKGILDVIFDVAGYYVSTVSGVDGRFNPMVPSRVLNTRDHTGSCSTGGTTTACATIGPKGHLDFQVAGSSTSPTLAPADAEAVVFNLTVTNATGPVSYVTAYPSDGSAQPVASNVNFFGGQTVPNRVTVKVGQPGGKVTLYNDQGTVDVIVDLNGYYSASGSTGAGSLYTPVAPTRLMDTRDGSGASTFSGSTGPAGVEVIQVAGKGGVAANATAAVLNLTATRHVGDPDYLTVYPKDATSRPNASDVNLNEGQTIPNLVVVKLSSDGKISIYNNVGSTDEIVDVFGYFGPAPSTRTVTVTANPTSVPADGTDTSSVKAVVKDAGGTVVQGATVTFTVSGSPAAACGSVAPTSGTTDAAGSVTTVYTASTTPGTCTVTATESAPNGASGSADITQTATNSTLAVTATPSTVPADKKSTSVISAQVNDFNGKGVPGDTVTFGVTNPSATGSCGTLSSTTAQTDSSGKASVVYKSSDKKGTCDVTATESKKGATGTTTVTQVPNQVTVTCTPPNGSPITNGVGGCTIPASPPPFGVPPSGTTITTTVTDYTGANVSGATVTLLLTPQPAGSCGSIVSSSGATNANGQSTAVYNAPQQKGLCTVTATESGTGASASAPILQTQNPPQSTPNKITLTCVPVNCTLPADGKSTLSVTAVVISQPNPGSPVSGDAVDFAIGPGGSNPPEACGKISVPSGTTDVNGQVTVLYTASKTGVSSGHQPACVIAAEEANSGSSSSKGINQTIVPNLIDIAFNPQAIPANGTSTSSVIVTVRDPSGAPLAGDSVGLSKVAANPAGPPSACGTLNPTSGTTDGAGQVTVSYTSSTAPGFCTIAAGESGTGSGTQGNIDQTTSPAPANGPYTVSIGCGTGGTGPCAGAASSSFNITVTVLDSLGAGTGSPSAAGSCGSLSPSPTFGTTNASGQVTFTYSASGTAGNCVVTAQEASTGATGSTTVHQS